MSIILFIVAASLFQTVLEITHPVLLALAASSRNIWSHSKVLILCTLLCLIPAYMSHLLISTVDLDLWTMVVVSSSLLTSIQVIGHFVHYVLYLMDSFRKEEPLESLDDYIYYLKSIVHSLEVMSALFVVCAGKWKEYIQCCQLGLFYNFESCNFSNSNSENCEVCPSTNFFLTIQYS